VPRLELTAPRAEAPRAPAAAPVPPPSPPAATSPPTAGIAARPAGASESTNAAGADHFRFEAGAGFRALLPDPRPGLLLEAALRKRAGGWGARLTLGGAWWSHTTLGPGQVSWTRLAAGLGLVHGWSGRRLFLDVHEELLAAALFAEGRGYDESLRRKAFDPGVGLGVRAGISMGGVRLWVDGGVAWWPIQQTLGVGNVKGTVNAAPFEGALSVGGSFRGGP